MIFRRRWLCSETLVLPHYTPTELVLAISSRSTPVHSYTLDSEIRKEILCMQANHRETQKSGK